MHTTAATEIRSRLDADQRSQAWLASRIGVSKSAMNRKMKGEVEFTLDEFLAACRVLGADSGEIIAAIDSEPSAA